MTINPELRSDFERDFTNVSVQAVEGREGFMGVEILSPSCWNPDEYLIITCWRDEAALIAFAGEEWNQAVIPGSMEKYVQACSVEHFVIPAPA